MWWAGNMFFDAYGLIPMAMGAVVTVFAGRIADAMRSMPEQHWLTAPRFRGLLWVWPTRFGGILCLVFGFLIAASGPSRKIMDKDVNRILLLENGKITKGEVTKKSYQFIASSGWKVVYKFAVKDPEGNEEKLYWGSAQGPRKYYGSLSGGDSVTIIYQPSNPKVNYEIRYFLNNPNYRTTFKKAGKLQLLKKFVGDYDVADYSSEQWYRLQRQR